MSPFAQNRNVTFAPPALGADYRVDENSSTGDRLAAPVFFLLASTASRLVAPPWHLPLPTAAAAGDGFYNPDACLCTRSRLPRRRSHTPTPADTARHISASCFRSDRSPACSSTPGSSIAPDSVSPSTSSPDS